MGVARAFGVRSPRLNERYVPSSEGMLRAACMGWGIGVVPELQARDLLGRGDLLQLRPEVSVDVTLFWHQWKLMTEAIATPGRVALLDQIGEALAAEHARPCSRKKRPQRVTEEAAGPAGVRPALLQRLAAVRGRLSLCADQAAAAKWWLSMPMASVSAEGPMPKLSPQGAPRPDAGLQAPGASLSLRRARMTSNPLIVA